MSDEAIRVEGLGKQYRIGGPPARNLTLREQVGHTLAAPWRALRRGGRGDEERTFWALRDVSFEVKRGEVVGIIGRNGAGKSTLLKILSRITEPTTGEVDLYGRVGSLLEVGTGFHSELTGRENVYLNGAILGMRRVEIARKFDEIVAFAEVEKFIDTPVKHYSSGMYMRLAFAVAAHLEPEILVIDEVLAVGDAEFQKKCLGRMGEVARNGRTVLFVSHNMAAVGRLCSRCILLEHGKMRHLGETTDAIQAYFAMADQKVGHFNKAGRQRTPDCVEVTDAWLECGGARVGTLIFGEQVDLVLEIAVKTTCSFSVQTILRQEDNLPVAFASSALGQDWEVKSRGGTVRVRGKLPPRCYAGGRYSLDIMLDIPWVRVLDYVEAAISFEVVNSEIGRNWRFMQSAGRGFLLWDVQYELG